MRTSPRRRWRKLTVGLAQNGPWLELMLRETGSLKLSHCTALRLHGVFDLLEVLLQRRPDLWDRILPQDARGLGISVRLYGGIGHAIV
jgi:hypothetical protein